MLGKILDATVTGHVDEAGLQFHGTDSKRKNYSPQIITEVNNGIQNRVGQYYDIIIIGR